MARGSIINYISQLNIISTPTEHNKIICGRLNHIGINQYNFTATAVYLERLKQTAGGGGQ